MSSSSQSILEVEVRVLDIHKKSKFVTRKAFGFAFVNSSFAEQY